MAQPHTIKRPILSVPQQEIVQTLQQHAQWRITFLNHAWYLCNGLELVGQVQAQSVQALRRKHILVARDGVFCLSEPWKKE